MSKSAAIPARVLRIEFAPPPGADLRRTIEVAQAMLAEYEADAPTVEFKLGALRVQVQAEGVV